MHPHPQSAGEEKQLSPAVLLALSAGLSFIVSLSVLSIGIHGYQHPTPLRAENERINYARMASADTSLEDMIARVQPAVASIMVTTSVPVDFGLLEGWNSIQEPQTSGGTAFFVRSDGLLVTNKHVIQNPDARFMVILHDGRRVDGRLVASDPTNDIALIQIDGSGYQTLDFSSDDLHLGQNVIAIGNALGEFRNSVSVGVVSGLNRTITAASALGDRSEKIDGIIQTDAAINQGSSGGPLLNTQGHVIGMNVAVAADAQSVGFAIPAADVHSAIASYEQTGQIVRPQLGVRYVQVNADMAQRNSLPHDYGVLLITDGVQPAVAAGSAAEKAGLRPSDIILSVDGTMLDSQHSLAHIVRRKLPGESMTLRVYRNRQEQDVVVQL